MCVCVAVCVCVCLCCVAGGFFPSQLPVQVVYAPGSQCAWMVQGLGGSLFASLNFSLLGQNDKLDVLATGNGGALIHTHTETRTHTPGMGWAE